uniref:Uncharacterized protein n=1 Tax=Fagus sylvatica TaxID=28930 RepID=A0A2N9EQP7_FAGSY
MAVLVQTPVRDRRLAMRDRTPVVHDRDLAAYARGLAVLVQTPVRDLAILIMNGSIRSLAWFSVNVDEPMGIATRDGGGFGLPIWWWGLGYGVAGGLWWWQWVANLAVGCCGGVVVWVGALLTPSWVGV